MLRLLERKIASLDRDLVLVAPPAASTTMFTNIAKDSERRVDIIRQTQRLRGAVYLHEGNVDSARLSSDGRYETPEDERSWHLLMLDAQGDVSSCIWYLEHERPASIDQLRLRHSPLAWLDGWYTPLKKSIELEIRRARAARLRYAEVGGWVVAKPRRRSCDGLVLALAAYGLCRLLGGALGVTTANVTHSSSSILRRLGGSCLAHRGVVFPPYFDPNYNARVELLRFDSRRPNGKYLGVIKAITHKLMDVPVIAPNLEAPVDEPYAFHAAQPQLAL